MIESYPAAFEIEIDREPLRRHLRWQHRQVWFWLMILAGLFAGCIVAAKYEETHAARPVSANLVAGGWLFLGVMLACQLLGVIGYAVSVRTIRPYVDGLLLAVDGPFLRLRKVVGGVEQDRKYHFNLLQVYATKQDARMKKLGIATLVITTAAGLQATRMIEVPAVKDCLRVRDMLAEIDSQREKA